MIIKAFRDWKFEEVELTFGIERVFTNHPLLSDWLSAVQPPNEQDMRTLERLRDELFRSVDTYNEEELKVFFIGPLLALIPFKSFGMRPFMDRPFSFEYGQNKQGASRVAAGRIDWLLARGQQDPREPRIFLHEYKKEVEATGDPLGQLLIAMVGSQRENHKKLPLFGCYVLGRNWFFVVLDDQQYAVSNAFNATEDDIFRIYSILYEVQQRVTSMVTA